MRPFVLATAGLVTNLCLMAVGFLWVPFCVYLSAPCVIAAVYLMWVSREGVFRERDYRLLLKQVVVDDEVSKAKIGILNWVSKTFDISVVEADAKIKKLWGKYRLQANRRLLKQRKTLRFHDQIFNEMTDYVIASKATMSHNKIEANAEQVLRFAAQWRWADVLASKGKRPPEVF